MMTEMVAPSTGGFIFYFFVPLQIFSEPPYCFFSHIITDACCAPTLL